MAAELKLGRRRHSDSTTIEYRYVNRGTCHLERHVFLSHVLEDKGFEELATELGITYKGAAAFYYRALQKIKKKIREDRDGFHGTAEAGKDWK